MKKLKGINKNEKKLKFDSFCKNHHTTRYIKYKVIDFATITINKSIMANKLPQSIWNNF